MNSTMTRPHSNGDSSEISSADETPSPPVVFSSNSNSSMRRHSPSQLYASDSSNSNNYNASCSTTSSNGDAMIAVDGEEGEDTESNKQVQMNGTKVGDETTADATMISASSSDKIPRTILNDDGDDDEEESSIGDRILIPDIGRKRGIGSIDEEVERLEDADTVDQVGEHHHRTASSADNHRIVLLYGVLLALALLISATILSWIVHRQLAQSEVTESDQHFDEFASAYLDLVRTRLGQELRFGRTLAVPYTIEALQQQPQEQEQGSSWPNVTLANFAARTATVQSGSGSATWIQMAPFLRGNEQRRAWEAYAREQQERLDAVYNCDGSSGKQPCFDVAGGIWELGVDFNTGETIGVAAPYRDNDGEPYYFPAWQVSSSELPPVESAQAVLFDLYSTQGRRLALDRMVVSAQPVISPLTFPPLPDQPVDLAEQVPQNTSRSQLFVPIYGELLQAEPDYVTGDGGDAPSGNLVVGTISLTLEWETVLSVLSPPAAVLVELENDFGQAATFRISADSTSSSIAPLVELVRQDVTDDNADTGSVTGPAILGYTLTVYQTPEYEEAFQSRNPLVMAIGISFIFVYCTVLFGVFCFARRQRLEVLSSCIPRRMRRWFSRCCCCCCCGLVEEAPEEFEPQQNEMQRIRKHVLARGKSSMLIGNGVAGGVSDDPYDADSHQPAKVRLRNFMKMPSRTIAPTDSRTEPIADLFPETTVMIADIAGFTAWSSEREPSQVFQLLETVYRAFDEIAIRLQVFKVETVGDSYVACSGLPDPTTDHAIIMARFAYECQVVMNSLVKELEAMLGPGTSDLALRIGLHSGSVTAGVLRAEKYRLQLFGDAMGTTARMECTSKRDRIQVSQDTADLLIAAGKADWIQPREGLVAVKGRGDMQTYWLTPNRSTPPSSSVGMGHDSSNLDGSANSNTMFSLDEPSVSVACSASTSSHGAIIIGRVPNRSRSIRQIEKWGLLNLEDDSLNAHKVARLVNWNCEVLLHLLSKVVAARVGRDSMRPNRRSMTRASSSMVSRQDSGDLQQTVIDEVTEIITLPPYNDKQANHHLVDSVPLSRAVRHQLHQYVSLIAQMYRDTPFHNLEHASHVTLSANKLMKRIIAPVDNSDDSQQQSATSSYRYKPKRRRSTGNGKSNYFTIDRQGLHNSTFGIASDPLTQFAIVFSALLHDVDHTGLPNAQLIKEGTVVAQRYNNKSVAEQNSVDLGWDLLMQDRFEDLRLCIYCNREEKKRFRQLVVNSVMATDIVDKDLRQLRNDRWDKAFHCSSQSGEEHSADVNRKATIVIEHIIQASDVAHCMQHWHVYCKWNERLYQEMMIAWCCGRAGKDPTDGWFHGEIWFFDNYIIPLAKKLEECGVFGVSSDEYLNYALENRREWEMKGRDVCKSMLENFKEQHRQIWTQNEARLAVASAVAAADKNNANEEGSNNKSDQQKRTETNVANREAQTDGASAAGDESTKGATSVDESTKETSSSSIETEENKINNECLSNE